MPAGWVNQSGDTPTGGTGAFVLPPEGGALKELEFSAVRQALERTDGNQSKAAKKLSLGIDAFRYRMKKFGFLS